MKPELVSQHLAFRNAKQTKVLVSMSVRKVVMQTQPRQFVKVV